MLPAPSAVNCMLLPSIDVKVGRLSVAPLVAANVPYAGVTDPFSVKTVPVPDATSEPPSTIKAPSKVEVEFTVSEPPVRFRESCPLRLWMVRSPESVA